jgi:pyruvate/2-oxoglutarate/acetoin dehydrogenase E1 component
MTATLELRCGRALNDALTQLFEERDDVYLLGEDILDPYGGAFRITQGLSSRWPERVLTTPISEAGLFGVAAGMALRGYRPVLEIMFGDFITLGFDQIVNGIGKFREMFDDQVRVPLVVRTPMGGGRGYGPTHSQSLEKFLLGVPGITVVAANEFQDLRSLVREAVGDDSPVFLIEHKLMYGRPNRRPQSGYLGEFDALETSERYPALCLSSNGFDRAAATIVTYGGLVSAAVDAAVELVVEDETFVEIVALGQLLPLALEPVLESVARTGALVTLEEGTLTAGVGAEIAARVQEVAWTDLRGPVRRIAAADRAIPAAGLLEAHTLPSAQKVVDTVRSIVRDSVR